MRKLIIVFNPRSTRAGEVDEEVLKVARKMKGVMVGRFEVREKPVVENAKLLMKMLEDGDIIITAGGDGTTEVGVNAIMGSGKKVRLGVLPFGNFNDVSRMFGLSKIEEIAEAGTVTAYPIECFVNGEHFQWAMGYFTAGMMAKAAEMLNSGERREHLRAKRRGTMYGLRNAVGWFVKNKRKPYLAGTVFNGVKMGDMTEYFAVNSGTMARIMKITPQFTRKEEFLGGVRRLRSFWKMAGFGMRNVIFGMKLAETRGDKIEFEREIDLMIQSEGECVWLENVRKMEFRKSGRGIEVFTVGD